VLEVPTELGQHLLAASFARLPINTGPRWTGSATSCRTEQRHDASPLVFAEPNLRPVPDPERAIDLEIIAAATATMTSLDNASAMLSALASVGTVNSTNPGPMVQQLV